MHFMALLGPLAFAELLRTVKADCLGDCPEGHHLIKIQPVVITYPEKGLASNTAFTRYLTLTLIALWARLLALFSSLTRMQHRVPSLRR